MTIPFSWHSTYSQDGTDLEQSAQQVRNEIRDLRSKRWTVKERSNRKAYLKFLRSRLKGITKAQRDLCRTCGGTGIHEYQQIIYSKCLICKRPNPNILG